MKYYYRKFIHAQLVFWSCIIAVVNIECGDAFDVTRSGLFLSGRQHLMVPPCLSSGPSSSCQQPGSGQQQQRRLTSCCSSSSSSSRRSMITRSWSMMIRRRRRRRMYRHVDGNSCIPTLALSYQTTKTTILSSMAIASITTAETNMTRREGSPQQEKEKVAQDYIGMMLDPLVLTNSSSSTTATFLQKKASFIATTFQFNEDANDSFHPFLTNCHIQTIGGYLLRKYCSYVPRRSVVGDHGTTITNLDDVIRTWWYILNGIWYTIQDNLHGDSVVAQAPLSSMNTTTNSNPTNKFDMNFWNGGRERIETPDGDWFHADLRYTTTKSGSPITNCSTSTSNLSKDTPLVILLHGLESNSNSLVSKHMAKSFTDIGMDCLCFNFRGCSGIPNNLLKAYHVGFTEDLMYYLERLRTKESSILINRRPIYLAGFSLGANVVLKFLGETSDRAVMDYNIQGAAVLCTPLDQERNAPILAQPGINRYIYTNNLLQSLKRRVRDQLHRLCNGNVTTDLFNYPGTQSATTITEFDNAYHPKVHGFEDCWDYYRKTSAIHFLDRITVPVFMLQAKDDPFMDPDVWPIEKSAEFGGLLPFKMIRTNHGGHLGYCFHQVSHDDDRLWTQQQHEGELMIPSWFAVEMSRFMDHVHKSMWLNDIPS